LFKVYFSSGILLRELPVVSGGPRTRRGPSHEEPGKFLRVLKSDDRRNGGDHVCVWAGF